MDVQKFLNASFAPREKDIPVPQLKEFFGKDEDPVWTVRGLNAAELGRAKELSSKEHIDRIRALVTAFSGESGDKAEEFRKVFGLKAEDVPQDVSHRMHVLAMGSVNPAIGLEDYELSTRLAETFPTIFYELSTAILALSGQGADLGKRKRSGKTAT